MVLIWTGFIGVIAAFLALDLGVLHRRPRVIGWKETAAWTSIWIVAALVFSAFVYWAYDLHWTGLGSQPDRIDGHVNTGATAALKFLAAYLVEKSLSVDNLFVIALLFGAFSVPGAQQHRVLFWGILGALVLRGVAIGAGVELIHRFHWVLYIFGGLLLITAVRLLVAGSGLAPGGSRAVTRARRWLPVTDQLPGRQFVARIGGRWVFTPLAVSLVAVEATDLAFAMDSLPAVFSITADPFLVFTSNVFAILGLRSLYFAVSGMVRRFKYLKPSLVAVLALVGTKLLCGRWLAGVAGPRVDLMLLSGIFGILACGVLASLVLGRERKAAAAAPSVQLG